MNASDTRIKARNFSKVGLIPASLTLMKERRGKLVDYAGAHSFLVRLRRGLMHTHRTGGITV